MDRTAPPRLLDHGALLDSLAATDDLLLIQDLDGVCMGLVRDPLTRVIDPRYVEAARRLDGQFYVLTNGEHVGRRGVNPIVEAACGGPDRVRTRGLYLPGLAAGGVQWQDRDGRVEHPGVRPAEQRFLARVPERAERFLRGLLPGPPFAMPPAAIDEAVAATVLDNAVSPTLNLNSLHRFLRERPEAYRVLQHEVAAFMRQLLDTASADGLDDAFFVHYAPNLGCDADGAERLRPGDADDAGTTDFQFMLRGALKEAGVLALLNRHCARRTGYWPLGEDFSVRRAPRGTAALRALARERFDRADMPRIVGVGDTVTSQPGDIGADEDRRRGGSDRGFLTLVQALGEDFGRGNVVAFVDSSGGEVRRPGVDAARLQRIAREARVPPWPALEGITDADDPLRLDVLFAGGHAQYVAFFRELAGRRGEGALDHT